MVKLGNKEKTVEKDDKSRVTELEQMKKSLEAQLLEMAKTVEQQQKQIAQAGRDVLTGLRNREGVSEQIDSILNKGNHGTFFIMDMDNFKSVNDMYGHIEGDKALVRFANALRNIMDTNDIVARIGGDEFIIFTPGKMSREMIREKAAHIVRYVEKKIIEPDKLVKVTVSMGIAIAPEDGTTFESLYRNGDSALYSVKNSGKNAFRFYDDMIKKKNNSEAGQDMKLSDIASRIKEKKVEGSFYVEYESFEKIYRFLERNIPREDMKVQCVLFTINTTKSNFSDEYSLQRNMEYLQNAIISTLRKGDVTTKCSKNQMIVILMDTDYKDAENVIGRILKKYNKHFENQENNIIYEIQQMVPEEECI